METLKFKDSPKRIVSKIVAWVCSIFYMLVIVVPFVFIFTGGLKRLYFGLKEQHNFSRLTNLDVGLLVSFILMCVFLIFSLNFYEWVLNPVLEVKSNKIIFKSNTVIAALGRATTTYSIKSISNFKVKRSSVIIYGKISVSEPLSKTSEKKSCEITRLYDDEDKSKVLTYVEGFMKNE